MGSALRVGGTMEVIAADADSGAIHPARVAGITRSVPEYFPDFTAEDFRNAPVWSGLRPCSPDGLPYPAASHVTQTSPPQPAIR
jgi:D-amino-acid dehydrogenase